MRSLKNNQGFTLVEIMIATGILIFIMFALSTYSISFVKANAKLERKMEANTVTRQIASLIHQGQNCKVSLEGMTVDPNPANAREVRELFYGVKDADGIYRKTSDPAYTKGAIYGKIRLDAIDVWVREQVSQNPRRFLANVRFAVSETIEGQVFPTPEVPVLITTDAANRVLFCNTVDQNENMMAEKVCEFGSGGLYMYDAVTGECIPNPDIETEWHEGSNTIATCPPNTKILPGEGSKSCGVENPAGHSDPFVQPPRRYLSGFEVDRPPSYVHFTKSVLNNSCTCDYAQDLPNPTAYRCKIQCFR